MIDSGPINGTNLFGGAAVIGVIVGFWNYIKIYASKILSLFIVRIGVADKAAMAVSILLNNEFKCSPWGVKSYYGCHEYVRPKAKNEIVAFETIPPEPTIWWRNKRPLIVSGEASKLLLTFIRGTYNRDSFILEAVNKFNASKNNKNWKEGDRFFIRKRHGSIGSNEKRGYNKTSGQAENPGIQEIVKSDSSYYNKETNRPLGWDREEIGQPKNDGAINKLSLNTESLTALEEALHWRDSESWFKERSIPWKRGWLLHGGVGCGKTAFTRALGQELNMPIFSFDLASMTNKDFSEAWSDIMGYSPCIALFEDIDSIFKGRENVAVKGLENGLTFDGFLNCIDGVENTDGIFVIITTNNIESMDSAIGGFTENGDMSTRPGRVDRSIKFEKLDREGRIKMAERIMNGLPENKWKHLIDDYVKDTGAQFQERCCRLALKLFWENIKEVKIK